MRSLASCVVLGLLALGCGEDGPKEFPSYQECFDELTLDDGRMKIDAIVACCLEHPINGTAPSCGADQSECINYLTVNLAQTDADITVQTEACTAYLSERFPPMM